MLFQFDIIKVLKKTVGHISSINYQVLIAWQLTEKILFTAVFQGIW